MNQIQAISYNVNAVKLTTFKKKWVIYMYIQVHFHFTCLHVCTVTGTTDTPYALLFISAVVNSVNRVVMCIV